jgi:hypothetical protein
MSELKVIDGGVENKKEPNIIKFSALDKEFEFVFEVVTAPNAIAFCYSQSTPNFLPFGDDRVNIPIKETLVVIRKKVPWYFFFKKDFWKTYEFRKEEGLKLCQNKFEAFKNMLITLRKEEQHYKNLVK